MCPALSPRPFASSPHRFSGGEDGRERDVIGSILTSARAAAHGRYGWNMTKALGSESPVDREVESTCQATYPTPDKGKHRSQLEGRPRYGRHRPPTKSGYHRTRSKTAYQRGTQRNRRSSISTEPKSPINANACSLPSPRPTRATSDCSRRVTSKPRSTALPRPDPSRQPPWSHSRAGHCADLRFTREEADTRGYQSPTHLSPFRHGVADNAARAHRPERVVAAFHDPHTPHLDEFQHSASL